MTLIDDLKDYAASRARELKDIASSELTVDEVTASVAGQQLKFRVNVERIAAWELYVELNTRLATQELDEVDGSLREAFKSLHALFAITRAILREAGPGVALGDESLGKYAMAILNRVLRPYLARWHPKLSDWESRRPPDRSAVEHEAQWEDNATARAELRKVQAMLAGYSEALAVLAGLVDAPG